MNAVKNSKDTSTASILFSILFLLFSGILFPSVGKSQTGSQLPHTIAEWEDQEACWTIWPKDSSSQFVIAKAIKALSGEVYINLVVESDSLRNYALLDLKNLDVDFGKIKIILNANAKGFMRDKGPWFLFDEKNNPAKTGFKWTNFGVPVELTPGISKKDSINAGKFASEVTGKMKLQTINSDLVIENGMLEINSNGVAICFMETILQRNPSFDLPAINIEMKRVLGLKKIIWLGSSPTMDKLYAGPKSANIFGNGANGHIDQYIRFANDSTILIAQFEGTEKRFDPVSSADYLIQLENLKYLNTATDENDHPFTIIEMPIPAMRFHMVEDTIADVTVDTLLYKGFENGTTIYHAPLVSYLNYYICNNTILLPEYFNEKLTDTEKAKDEQVETLFKNLYPGKKIVRINPIPLNLKGGGLHRAFLSQPNGIQQSLSK